MDCLPVELPGVCTGNSDDPLLEIRFFSNVPLFFAPGRESFYSILELVEPLRELLKDEVRRIGVERGLPSEMVYRHLFPGPGLGVRILGEVKKEYDDLLRQADHIYIEELYRQGLYNEVSQAFAVFLPVKSVGVAYDISSKPPATIEWK